MQRESLILFFIFLINSVSVSSKIIFLNNPISSSNCSCSGETDPIFTTDNTTIWTAINNRVINGTITGSGDVLNNSGIYNFELNYSYQRTLNNCSAGNSIREVLWNGSVVCEADSVGYDSLSDLEGAVSNDFHNLGGTDLANSSEQIIFVVSPMFAGYTNISYLYTLLGSYVNSSTLSTYANSSLLSTYVNSSNISLYNQNLNTTKNVTFANVTATEFLIGQPLTGMLGSGIIQSTGVNALSEVNVTCSGLTCSYNAFQVRLMSATSGTIAKYCSIPAGSQTATNGAHNVLYIDSSCNIQVTTISSWFDTLIKVGAQWDFANMVCYNSACEVVNGIGLEQRRMMKQRIINFNKNHLSVISGFTKTTSTFPNFTISLGRYIYLMDVVDTPEKIVGTINSTEIIIPNGTGWIHVDQSTMNYSTCQNGTTAIPCSPTNKWRRVFFFMIGYNTSIDYAGIHQLLPTNSISYTTEASCLDTNTNPLTYTLPTYYLYSAVPLYAYCIRPTDTSWSTTGWIDLRTVKSAVGASVGTSTVYVPYVGATQDVNLGTYLLFGGGLAANINASYVQGLPVYNNVSRTEINTGILNNVSERILNATNTVSCGGENKTSSITITNGVLTATCTKDYANSTKQIEEAINNTGVYNITLNIFCLNASGSIIITANRTRDCL